MSYKGQRSDDTCTLFRHNFLQEPVMLPAEYIVYMNMDKDGKCVNAQL